MNEMRSQLAAQVSAIRAWWGAQRRPVRWGMLGGSCLAALLVLALWVTLASSPGVEDGVVIVPATRTPAPTLSRLPDPGTPSPRAREATPTPEASPEADVVTSLRDLVERVGYPAETTFARLRVPATGLDAPVGSRVVQRGEPMPEPIGPAHLLWYDLSQYPDMGGAPGGGGNAIFGGHVDWNDRIPYAPDVRFRGPAAFFDLGRLSAGDIIEVDYGGETLRYRVVWREAFSAEPGATDWGAIWRGRPGVDEITLYTCGGAFDAATRSYADRVVVRAERM